MVRFISLLLASVTTTYATSSLTAAKVDADVRVPNASFAKKVNTAVLQVQTPGPSFLLFGFPKCGTTTLWDWITQHPKIKGKEGRTRVMKEIHSLDNGGSPFSAFPMVAHKRAAGGKALKTSISRNI